MIILLRQPRSIYICLLTQNKLASSKLRLSETLPSDRLTDWLTGVKCRATSVAKKKLPLYCAPQVTLSRQYQGGGRGWRSPSCWGLFKCAASNGSRLVRVRLAPFYQHLWDLKEFAMATQLVNLISHMRCGCDLWLKKGSKTLVTELIRWRVGGKFSSSSINANKLCFGGAKIFVLGGGGSIWRILSVDTAMLSSKSGFSTCIHLTCISIQV